MRQAQIDKIYVESGILSREEVRVNRFQDSGFSYETFIDDNEVLLNEEMGTMNQDLNKDQVVNNEV